MNDDSVVADPPPQEPVSDKPDKPHASGITARVDRFQRRHPASGFIGCA